MLRVLLADDEEIIRNSISKMIPWESLGCELVGAAANGMEAYNMICDSYPDIVITDIKMPILDGLELIERAVLLDKDIEFIVLSGYSDFKFAQKAMKYGVRYYHLKPTRREDLEETLKKISEDARIRAEKEQQRRESILLDLKYPLQKSLLLESLNSPLELKKLFHNYSGFLKFSPEKTAFCLCSFLEEPQLSAFLTDIFQFLKKNGIAMLFPPVYVKNNLSLLLRIKDLTAESALNNYVLSRSYPGQTVGYETRFYHYGSLHEALEVLIMKVSRYGRILFTDPSGRPEEVRNSLTEPLKIGKTEETVLHASETAEIIQALREIFSPVNSLITAQVIAIRLLLQIQNQGAESFLHAQDLQNLYTLSSVQDILDFTCDLILKQRFAAKGTASLESPVEKLKLYVDQHLDSENLSLKWLAEHLLFISVGYLSKLFLRTEGEKFSEYLNKKRMERAKELMRVYHNTNIQDIAQEVGFGNNPRYFGQVFKKYTGITPSEYMQKL
ncbi:response regulator transcription factor [Lachnotalea sp. AF33-28]|uniref:response regulator transcription factor n=1 Tax=Lachnotalea sp. AF33-28 TaxID=2292046 RepID=UPI000E537B1F|nr:response regulator [Lachnotalea sp. AF33-28]RHP33527.1 response regulator [Lachnotalea sp. AF33-28]